MQRNEGKNNKTYAAYTGLKKVPSGSPEQVDSPSGQETFHTHMPGGQGLMQAVYQLNH